MTKEKRQKPLTTLLRPEEKRAVEERAEQEGLSLSTFTRRVLLQSIRQSRTRRGSQSE